LNGTAKTTTIRIVLDLLRPTSGNAAIFGHDCQ
jgi:ABC-type multidrug transport system ATPase subunit